jgi:stage II sporulation protein R
VAIPILQAQTIYDETIRLHILANSDSPEDQNLKLLVRDDLLSYCNRFQEMNTKEDAMTLLENSLEDLQKIASDRILAEGYSYPVQITLDREYYETREYEDFRLPAGVYTSLQVIIGDGNGKNWWCVLFPPLCTSSCRADEELAEVGFTPSQVRLLTDDDSINIVVRFRIVELFGEIKQKISSVLYREE